MNTLIFVLAFCIVAVLVYMARYSGRLRVTQTRTIDAPIDVVYAQIAELANWQAWNPWLEHERDAPVQLHGSGNGPGDELRWEGPRIGAGSITHMRLQAPARIKQRLRFAQPFRFRGRAHWHLEASDGQTVVTWAMRGRVSFSMRAFAKTVQGMIALDFRHGLARLAQTVEAQARSAYAITYLGPRNVPVIRCAHLPYRGPLDGLGAAIPKTVAQVRQRLAAPGLPATGEALAIYVKTNVKLRSTECRVGIDVGSGAAGPLAVHETPPHRAYVVRFEGPPAMLEIAWYQGMQRLRIENLEPDLRIAPFERYPVDPDLSAEQRVVVELYLPLKSGAV